MFNIDQRLIIYQGLRPLDYDLKKKQCILEDSALRKFCHMTIALTEKAAQKILSLMQEEPTPKAPMFRVLVSGGGCAGFEYHFSLDEIKREDDRIIKDKGVQIVIDEASLPFLEGVEIDYVEELIGSTFRIKNPNASSACGCGNSFSV